MWGKIIQLFVSFWVKIESRTRTSWKFASDPDFFLIGFATPFIFKGAYCYLQCFESYLYLTYHSSWPFWTAQRTSGLVVLNDLFRIQLRLCNYLSALWVLPDPDTKQIVPYLGTTFGSDLTLIPNAGYLSSTVRFWNRRMSSKSAKPRTKSWWNSWHRMKSFLNSWTSFLG